MRRRFPAKFLRSVPGLGGSGEIFLAGDRAYVLCPRYSYGVWVGSFGYIDLKTRQYHALPKSEVLFGYRNGRIANLQGRRCTIVPGSEGRLFLSGPDGVFIYQPDGKVTGPVFSAAEGKLLGVWNRQAVLSIDQSIEFQRMPRTVAQAKQLPVK